jgi:hypothetical protein
LIRLFFRGRPHATMSIYCWCPKKKPQYVVVLRLTSQISGRTIAPALKEVETA